MPCLNVDIKSIINPISVSLERVGSLQGVDVRDVTSHLNVDFGIVCTVAGDYILRFEKAILTWNGADNREGVIKYNTLTASGAWSLEEIEIEELL